MDAIFAQSSGRGALQMRHDLFSETSIAADNHVRVIRHVRTGMNDITALDGGLGEAHGDRSCLHTAEDDRVVPQAILGAVSRVAIMRALSDRAARRDLRGRPCASIQLPRANPV
jgi:hypothetical protein